MATYWSQRWSSNLQYKQWASLSAPREDDGPNIIKYRQARFTMDDETAATVQDGDYVMLMPMRLNECIWDCWAFTDGRWSSASDADFSIGVQYMAADGFGAGEMGPTSVPYAFVSARPLLDETTYYLAGVSPLNQNAFYGQGSSSHMNMRYQRFATRCWDMPYWKWVVGEYYATGPVNQNTELVIAFRFNLDGALTTGGTVVFQYWYTNC